MVANSLPNGTEVLMSELTLNEVMHLIERTAKWVAQETFSLLPVWYPEHARKSLFYKNNWTKPLLNTNKKTGDSVHKQEGNTSANQALTHALGLRPKGRKDWSCCHIWGVDDSSHQEANVVVQDHRFFSCVANMVLLPTPLKAFTDTIPEVKGMLRICAHNFYGWRCDHESMMSVNAKLDEWQNLDEYPENWPRKIGDPISNGVMPINDDIRKSASRRWEQIQKDIKFAGQHYPHDEVQNALTYWKLDLNESITTYN